MFVIQTAQTVWSWLLGSQDWLWAHIGVPLIWIDDLLTWAGNQTLTIQLFCLVAYLAAGILMARAINAMKHHGRLNHFLFAICWGPLVGLVAFGGELIALMMFYSLWMVGALMILTFLMLGLPTELILRWICSFFTH